MGPVDQLNRWMYRNGHPNLLARLLNRASATTYAAGLWPTRLDTLEVRGRRSGRLIFFLVVIADLDDERYLVAMLGESVNWVRNVRAAQGRTVLRHGCSEAVLLEEVDPESRAPIERRYLACAPGAQPHPRGPPRAYHRLRGHRADDPVFRITRTPRAEPGGSDTGTRSVVAWGEGPAEAAPVDTEASGRVERSGRPHV